MAERKKTIEINRINLTSALNPFRVQSKTSYSDLSNSDTSSTVVKIKPDTDKLFHLTGRPQPQKDPSIIALEEQIAANQAKINLGETTMAQKKLASMRARQGRGGAYSLLGSLDRLG